MQENRRGEASARAKYRLFDLAPAAGFTLKL